jgi:urocanate hydratase
MNTDIYREIINLDLIFRINMEKTMNSNILDYMYEGYGYDFEDQRLYNDPEKYEEALTEESKMSTSGMETFSHQGIVSHDPALEVEKANKYTELGQFVGENGANYTDLRPRICGCN